MVTADAYGIDFGTTNSVLARATRSSVDAVVLGGALPPAWAGLGFERVLPSVIGRDGAGPTFGWAAKLQRGDRIEAVKRLFATDDTVTLGGEELPVEEAAALYFRHLRDRAAAAGLPSGLDRAVVTIPANSRGLARHRTKRAAGLAGIEVLALINEPTAAAMAHARAIGRNQRVLVFDWGGGTLDVTVLQAVEGTFIEQASKGIQRLGGLDLDRAFADALLPRIPGAAAWRGPELAEFRLGLERAKVALSGAPRADVELPGGGTFEVTRGHFEEVVWPLVKRTREPVDVCLRESPGRIDHLVMVGGSAKLPAVRRFIGGIVGAEPGDEVDPMTAVAEGAALAAGILEGVVTDLDFHVGTEHALGTVVYDDPAGPGQFSVLIPRNTKYPARATDVYAPATDFQDRVTIEVVEGDPDKPLTDEDNVVLKRWPIALPERRPAAEAAFSITYEYDLDGILHVLVRDRKTGAVWIDDELTYGTEAKDTAADRAEREVLPFVDDADATILEELIERARTGGPDAVAALERELLRHPRLG